MFRVSTLDTANLPRNSKGEVDFSRDFFGKETFLTVSGQLNVEAYCLALSKVYTFGPTFRAENSNTTRHLAEFWMIEPEIAFADLAEDARLAEEFLKYLFRAVLDERGDDMAFFAERVDKTAISKLEDFINAPFERIEYTDAIKLLQESKQKFEFPVEWGMDLQSEHERWLTEQHVGRPVVVTNYPEHIKAFYMRLNDDGKTVAAMDVLAPGIGEIIGGSQREERLDVLDRAHGPVRPGSGALRLVSRFPPLRHGAARGLRPGLRAPGGLRLRAGQHPRLDPLPARARQCGVLIDDPVLRPAVRRHRHRRLLAFVIFWPLTLVHVRDRHPEITAQLGTGAFLKPAALAWLLSGRYRESRDSSLSGLATPAKISLLVIFGGLACAGLLWLAVAGDGMNDTIDYQWYVASLGRTLVWARLRLLEAGTAEVFDSDGNTLTYDSDDTARAALFDAEFVAFDGLDEDDALARGFSLDEVSPPRADNDAALRGLMVQSLGARA